MQLLVLGANGGVGRLVVDEALKRRHTVRAFVRSPETLRGLADRIEIAQGDALDAHAVADAVRGQDAVIYALGAGNVRHTTLFSDSTRVLLTAMERHGVQRLVCVTGVGAGDTKGHGGFMYDRIVYPLFTKGIYEDKDRQESVIRASRTHWTIVRPAPFRKDGGSGPLRAVTDVDDLTLRRISRAEVARFLVDELEQPRFIHQAVFIGHE